MTFRYITNGRSMALAYLFVQIMVTAACNSSGGEAVAVFAPEPVSNFCNSTSLFENGECRTFARRVDTRASTPFTENGQPVTLEVVLFKPLEGSRFPTVVFHHGSTGSGSDPALFTQTFVSKALAQHFVERGWMIAFPQRRGRGQSDGLYDEGFKPDRSAYACQPDLTLAGAQRALEDLDAITDWLISQAEVDTTRMLMAGTSRGGILSIAHLSRRPEVYLSAVNFVGGWLGEGCAESAVVNQNLFRQGSTFTGRSLWLYGTNDSFYSMAHSRANHEAFTAAGGLGDLHFFTRAPGLNGHFLVNDPALWELTLDNFIDLL